MSIYRVATVGCRSRGTAISQAYHAHPRTEVVGLCDLLPERAAELGERLGVVARFTDLDRMIRETGPDIVVIATGTEFHYDLCLRVLEHGVHIDVEKPLCTDLEQADAVLGRAREKGVRVAVHHQGRAGASMRALMRALEAGKIGHVRYIYGSGKGYYAGYGLMNIGTHVLTNMIKFGGHVRSVAAVILTDGRPITPKDVLSAPGGMGTIAGEHLTATLRFEGNVTGTLLQHRLQPVDSAAYAVEVFGSEGRLFWKSDRPYWLPVPHFIPDPAHNLWEPLEPEVPEGFDPEKSSLDDYWFVEEYVRALDEGREHECSAAEAVHALEIMMGIFESGAYGTCVSLPQQRRDHPLLRWRAEAGLAPPAPGPREYGAWLAEEDRRLGRR